MRYWLHLFSDVLNMSQNRCTRRHGRSRWVPVVLLVCFGFCTLGESKHKTGSLITWSKARKLMKIVTRGMELPHSATSFGWRQPEKLSKQRYKTCTLKIYAVWSILLYCTFFFQILWKVLISNYVSFYSLITSTLNIILYKGRRQYPLPYVRTSMATIFNGNVDARTAAIYSQCFMKSNNY